MLTSPESPELEELKRVARKYFNKMEEVLATARALRRGRADNEMGTEERLIEMGYRKDYNSMIITYDSLVMDIKEMERALAFERKYNEYKKAKLYLESPFDMMLETQGELNIKNL